MNRTNKFINNTLKIVFFVFLFLFIFNLKAFAQSGAGVFTFANGNCGSISNPVINNTYCLTPTSITVWNGSSYVNVISGGGSVPNGSPPQIVGYSAANTGEAETLGGDATLSRTGTNAYSITVTKTNGVAFTGVATATVGSGLSLSGGILSASGGGGGAPVVHTLSATDATPSLTCTSGVQQDVYVQAPTISSVTPNFVVGSCAPWQTIFYQPTQGSNSTVIGNFTASSGTVQVAITGGNQLPLGAASGDWVLYQIKYDGTNWELDGLASYPAQPAGLSVTGSTGALQTNNGSGGLGAYTGALCSSGVIDQLSASGAATCTLVGTVSITPQNTVGCTDTSLTITGAATTMGCIPSPAGTLASADANIDWSCYVSAANTVQVHICTIVALTGAAQSFNVRLIP